MGAGVVPSSVGAGVGDPGLGAGVGAGVGDPPELLNDCTADVYVGPEIAKLTVLPVAAGIFEALLLDADRV